MVSLKQLNGIYQKEIGSLREQKIATMEKEWVL